MCRGYETFLKYDVVASMQDKHGHDPGDGYVQWGGFSCVAQHFVVGDALAAAR
jgi:hypothetical protein